jgi:hypothetical protein
MPGTCTNKTRYLRQQMLGQYTNAIPLGVAGGLDGFLEVVAAVTNGQPTPEKLTFTQHCERLTSAIKNDI